MVRLKCKKCNNVFEISGSSVAVAGLIHFGSISPVKCPACGKTSWMNILSSVKDPLTWPPQEMEQKPAAVPELTEEELEKKRIEESKYERS
jgi:formate dehydrogenase maturation protein FdhE